MRAYNSKEWWGAVFSVHKSDTLRVLWPLVFTMLLYSAGVVWVETEWTHLTMNPYVKELPTLHTLLGLVLSLLLVFRTNTAYDRWWEGRKLWGNLVNNSRNLALKLKVLLPGDQQAYSRHFFARMIPLYARSLDKHLKQEALSLELDGKDHPELVDFDHTKHMPNQVASLILKRANECYKQGDWDGFQHQTLTAELQSLTDICGACERIKNTPIPYSYAIFIKKFIFIYCLTLPWGWATKMGWLTVPVVAFVFYALTSLEVVAEEIEEPFGGDENDVPTEKLAINIGKNIKEILD